MPRMQLKKKKERKEGGEGGKKEGRKEGREREGKEGRREGGGEGGRRGGREGGKEEENKVFSGIQDLNLKASQQGCLLIADHSLLGKRSHMADCRRYLEDAGGGH